jgi:hypothetical protein
MLNSLLGLGKGVDVYLSVSTSCGLEMMEVDKQGNVRSYAQTPLVYNDAQREIANYDDFKAALETLFQMRNINPAKASIHLSLPTVWFGYKEGLPLLLDDSAITNIVIGELEMSYIFKRKDPLPVWFDALASTNSDSRSVFYSAVQKDAVESIKEILTSMGATLASVECSLFSDLKGLYVTGIAAQQMDTDQSWALMIINNNGFQLLGMQGKRIIEYFEEAIPIKSFEGEEVYSEIENSAQIALMNNPSSSLIIVSETDLVSSTFLASRLQFSGEIIPIEDNQFRERPLMEMSWNIIAEDQIKVSLNSIGAMTPAGIMPIDINYIAEGGKTSVAVAVIEIPIGDKIFELTPQKATIIATILLALILIPLGLGYICTGNMLTSAEQKNADIDNQITQVQDEIKKYQADTGKVEFDAVAEIEKVLKNNRTKIMAYTALGESIPQNLYLTYFITGDEGTIDIRGCADSVEDVYVFFKNLKDSLIDSGLRLSKLDLKEGSLDDVVKSTASTIDNAPYVFEITNMSDDQLKSFMDNLIKKPEGDKQSTGRNADNQNSDNNRINDNNESKDNQKDK